jgi:predicted pyridoxine 5'-phosphate oxidase superfamily flavin-nucleotide-binding protein
MMIYHEGELAVQIRAGVAHQAQRIGRGIHPAIPPNGQYFLREQMTAVAGTVGEDGSVWASLLTGEPGFILPLDEYTLLIQAQPVLGDPLADNLRANHFIGLVVIEFATRGRVRLNGTAEVTPDGLRVSIKQAYANCPRFIQPRRPHELLRAASEAQQANVLSISQQRWIMQADTFFIASFHPGSGADASHRGGKPGFARVLNGNILEFPDYAGNTMFNTLGNITANPHSGLLFLDFEHGSTLQLSGQAEIIWAAERAAQFPMAERVVEFHVESVLEITNAFPFRFDASPFG